MEWLIVLGVIVLMAVGAIYSGEIPQPRNLLGAEEMSKETYPMKCPTHNKVLTVIGNPVSGTGALGCPECNQPISKTLRELAGEPEDNSRKGKKKKK